MTGRGGPGGPDGSGGSGGVGHERRDIPGPALSRFAALMGLALLTACAAGPGGGGAERPGDPATPGTGPAGAGEESDLVPPPGFGTLRQDDVTLSFRSRELLIKVTPLDPGVIRVLASDTWERLRDLREGRRPELARRSGMASPDLFLVSFFSYEPEVRFQPEDLHLLNRGLRFSPLGIGPVTPGWGRQRLAQEETQMAVYAFDSAIDLDQNLIAEYGEVRGTGWERILQDIQSERTRILARARSGP